MRTQQATRIRWQFLLVNLLVIALVYSPVIASEPETSNKDAEKVSEVGVASRDATSDLAPKSATGEELPPPKPASSETLSSGGGSESSNEADIKRRGRAESVTQTAAPPTSGESSKTVTEKPAAEKSKAEAAPVKSGSSASKSSKPTPASRASSTKSKLPPNLGAVTSTGSGGATHYMSKGDPFQAIEQKHAMMSHSMDLDKRSDKRTSSSAGGLKHFGIQKAGGLSDYLNPFKGTDTGLARTLGASMRSIIKGKYSVPAYVASALLGAVALMAFYESPMSPLPVPPLPEPPVGRFPPEMPILSPNTQVPYRQNQGQYNQRSSMVAGVQQPMYPQQQQQLPQQHQQVLFQSNNQMAQQRQMNIAPMQQLAANLVPFTKPIQRKSSIEYDNILTRSSTSGSKPQAGNSKSNSILSFFGFGNSPSSTQQTSAISSSSDPLQASAPANDPKGPQSSSGPGMSNSHLVNKVKSYFNRAGNSPASSASSASGGDSQPSGNLYDQYQRMSFVQALMKDTAFIPAFLTSNKKSSPASGSSQVNKSSGAGSNVAAARMQVDAPVNAPPASMLPPKQRSAGFGLSRISDKIAHALLETFASGIVQRSGLIGSDKISARKSAADDHYGSSSDIASATGSILSDIISNLNHLPEQQQHHHHPQQQQQHLAAPSDHQQQQHPLTGKPVENVAAKQGQVMSVEQVAPKGSQQSVAPVVDSQQSATNQAQAAPVSHLEQAQAGELVRKTRSIGLEYPVEIGTSSGSRSNNSNNNNQEPALRESQPNKATQINNVIDFVADSYTNNRLLFNFFMNQVGLSQAVPYVEQIFATGSKHS